MKKRVLSLLMVATVAFALVGCGGDKADSFTGTKTGEVAGDKGTTVAEVKYENGKPVDVNIDVKNTDGTTKSKQSEEGKYVMKQGEANAWHKQIDMLEAFIKENNFDLTKVTYTNDAGNTDAVSGVSIKVKEYVDVVDKAMKSEAK
ncbi:MAG: hypothetical protein ACRC7N_06665 [Clostridium sp.]